MNSLFQASVAAGPSERSVSLRWWYSDDLWHRRQVGSGGLIEFELAIQVGRCDRWRSGWKPTAFRNASIAEGAVRAAITFMRPEQLGHTLTSY